MDEYTGLAGRTIRKIMDHLRSKIKLTTAQRAAMQDQIQHEWDQTSDIATYFQHLEQTKTKLGRWKINISEETMLDAAIKQIYRSNVFT